MTKWSEYVARLGLQLGTVVVQAALMVWCACAPLVWLLRDGLGPDSVESGWGRGALRFMVCWGGPALVMAVSLVALSVGRRRMGVRESGLRAQ